MQAEPRILHAFRADTNITLGISPLNALLWVGERLSYRVIYLKYPQAASEFILFYMYLYVTKVHLPLVRAVSWVPDPEPQHDPLRLRQGKEEP